MPDAKTKGNTNRGFCEHCHRVVPVRHQARDGKMYLVKDCPNCGTVETLVSRDAARYLEKRRMCQFDQAKHATCHLHCIGCDHGFTPKLVHIDVTNRCNMNCSICLANVGAMGFDFNPPLAYFERIFQKLAQYEPKPRVQFFGGEPTARDDFIDIVRLARQYDLPTRVVTNGIRLADEQYCNDLLDARVEVLLGFDGRHPDVYKKMRRSSRFLDLKLQALDNIKKYRPPEKRHKDSAGEEHYSSRRMTIICTVGLGINDKHMADFFQFCHERREQITAVALIPLQVTPGPVQIAPESTTIEDVEHIVADTLPGTEFIPVGLLQGLETIQETFDIQITFGGSHPNCESITLLIADEHRYRPASDYLKKSLGEVAEELFAWDRAMGEKLKTSRFARWFGRRGRQLLVGWGLLRLVRRNFRIGRFLGPTPIRSLAAMVWRKITTGKQWKKLFRRYTGCRGVLRLIVLPYEDEGWLETERLMTCPVAFAYEHPETGEVGLMPFCTYFVYKNEVLRKTAERWSRKDAVPAKARPDNGSCGEDARDRRAESMEPVPTSETA